MIALCYPRRVMRKGDRRRLIAANQSIVYHSGRKRTREKETGERETGGGRSAGQAGGTRGDGAPVVAAAAAGHTCVCVCCQCAVPLSPPCCRGCNMMFVFYAGEGEGKCVLHFLVFERYGFLEEMGEENLEREKRLHSSEKRLEGFGFHGEIHPSRQGNWTGRWQTKKLVAFFWEREKWILIIFNSPRTLYRRLKFP